MGFAVREGESPLHGNRPDFLEGLLCLAGQHAQEDQVALGHKSLVVVVDLDPEVLLEGSQQVRLPCRHVQTHVRDARLGFN